MSAVLEALSSYTIPSAETFCGSSPCSGFWNGYKRNSKIRWFEIAFLIANLQKMNNGIGLTVDQITDAWNVVESASYEKEHQEYRHSWDRPRTLRTCEVGNMGGHLRRLAEFSFRRDDRQGGQYLKAQRLISPRGGRLVTYSTNVNPDNWAMWDKIMQIDF